MDSSLDEIVDGSASLSLSLRSCSSDVEDAVDGVVYHSPDALDSGLSIGTFEDDLERKTVFSGEDRIIECIRSQLSVSGVSLQKIQKLSDATESMRTSMRKFVLSRLICNAVSSLVEVPSKLPKATIHAVGLALEHISCLDYVTSLDSGVAGGLFGVSCKQLEESRTCELNTVEIKLLRDAVEEEITMQHKKLLELNKKYIDVMTKVSGPVVCTESNCLEKNSTHELQTLSQNLHREKKLNVSYLEYTDKLLGVLTKLNLEDFESISQSRLKLLRTGLDFLKLQILSLHEQTIRGLYFEDPNLIDAHMTLKKNLDLAIYEAKSKLQQLQRRDTDFEKLRGTHFDRLLKEYCNLRSEISHKQYALSQL